MKKNAITELTRFRANLTRSLTRRGERLLEAKDPARLVAALEPLEAYFIARELGLDQARPILAHYTPEQVQACVDLSCWHHYDFQAAELGGWLMAIAGDDPTAMARTFLALDPEVRYLFLAQTVKVYSFEDDQIPDDESEETLRAMTPDSRYLLERIDGEQGVECNPLGLVGALYQHDPAAAEHLLTAVRWDMRSQIEEDALRFRSGRMDELGFVAPDEAAVLFTSPPSQPPPRVTEPAEGAVTLLPALYARQVGESNLFVQTLALITDPGYLARLEQELVWTINSAIVAYGETPRDIDHVSEIAIRVRDTISLGLARLLAKEGQDPESASAPAPAVTLLWSWSLADLFRHGYVALRALRQEVNQAVALPRVHEWYQLPETEQTDELADRLDREFVRALLSPHPLLGGFDLAHSDRVRAFATLHEISAAEARLKRLMLRLA